MHRSSLLMCCASLVLFCVGMCCELTVAQDVETEDNIRDDVFSEAKKVDSPSIDPIIAMNLSAKAFRVAAQKIEPALVTIESYGGVGAKEGRIGGIRKQGEGNTTGVMVSPDGFILTSTFNFIQEPPVITVITSDGKRHYAKLMGRDDSRKICMLKIDKVNDLPVPETISPDKIPVGTWAVSIGVGYGDTNPALSIGIISAKNRVGGRAIQTDANISPANYGGPLVDVEGRMIGLCVPMNPQSQAIGAGVEWYDSGIGFAIPVDIDDEVIQRLKDPEFRAYPAFLGVQMIPNPGDKGLWIEQVVKGSPAEAANLQRGDVILGINDEEVTDMLQLRQVLNRFESGDQVELRIFVDEDQKEDDRIITFGPPQKSEEESQLERPKIR